MSPRVVSLLVLAVGAAWCYLLYQTWQMSHLLMDRMWMPPSRMSAWAMGDFIWVFGMWAVMMAAMMLPTALPMLAAFARYCRRDSDANEWRGLWFGSGYLAVWMIFSVVLTLLQWLFHGWAWLSPMMESRQPLFAAAIFLGAGAYQFTAFKQACLHYCRTPFGFLLQHWRPGNRGALRIGFKHGLNCLGCCWAQMLIMFAVGVMNLGAMLLITLWVLVEKWAPVEAKKLSYGGGLLFLFAGAYRLFSAI
jgi:predicted metal-binding membrane protein